ncbi:unnamed protein product [Coccothraustes coccothraustes]
MRELRGWGSPRFSHLASAFASAIESFLNIYAYVHILEFPCKDSHDYFYNEFFIISHTVLLKEKRTEN